MDLRIRDHEEHLMKAVISTGSETRTAPNKTSCMVRVKHDRRAHLRTHGFMIDAHLPMVLDRSFSRKEMENRKRN